MNPESFLQIIHVLGKKLEPGPLAIAIGALAPLVESIPSPAVAKLRPKHKAQPKAGPKASAANGSRPSSVGAVNGSGARCLAALQADPDLAGNAAKLAAKVGCSRATAGIAVRRFKGEGVPPVSRPGERARALLREKLAHGPKPGEEIEAAAEAAEIPGRSLVAAASALGVTTRNGEWRLPG